MNRSPPPQVYTLPRSEELVQLLEAAGTKLVVLDFYAEWCGPCKMIAPIVEELSKANPNILFVKVDVDKSEELAQKYNITGMPTFIFIKNKIQVSSFQGANVQSLHAAVQQHQ